MARRWGRGANFAGLGVTEMILLSNVERAFVGLDGFGLRVLETREIERN